MKNEDDLRDEFEHYDEWIDRDPELEHMSLEEYDFDRCVETYGSTDEDLDSGDLDD